jgi:hypothetical protein
MVVMAGSCKNGTIPSISAYGLHGGSDVLMGPSNLGMGGMEFACKNGMTRPFWHVGGMEAMMFRLTVHFGFFRI